MSAVANSVPVQHILAIDEEQPVDESHHQADDSSSGDELQRIRVSQLPQSWVLPTDLTSVRLYTSVGAGDEDADGAVAAAWLRSCASLC